MVKDNFEEQYKKDIQHLSQAFNDDEPKTFKEHIASAWDETKNITKVWIGMGLASAMLFTGFATYKYQSGKDYVKNEFLPAFKEKVIARCDYNNNPSKENKINYLEKKGKLESLIKPGITSKGDSPEKYFESHKNIFYYSNCEEPDLDSKLQKPCYVLFGNILEIAKLKENIGDRKILTGRGYLINHLEQHNAHITKNFTTTEHFLQNFVVVADDSISKKDYKEYLKIELKKMINSDSNKK